MLAESPLYQRAFSRTSPSSQGNNQYTLCLLRSYCCHLSHAVLVPFHLSQLTVYPILMLACSQSRIKSVRCNRANPLSSPCKDPRISMIQVTKRCGSKLRRNVTDIQTDYGASAESTALASLTHGQADDSNRLSGESLVAPWWQGPSFLRLRPPS